MSLRYQVGGREVPLSHLAGFPVIWLFSLGSLAVDYTRSRSLDSRQLVIVFMIFTILYVTGWSNAVEFSENQRLRFVIDPFNLVILGTMIQWVADIVRRRYNVRRAPL